MAQAGTVDEDGLPGGIAGGIGDVGGEATVATGNVSALFNSGADQPLTYNLNTVTTGLPTLTSGGVAVTYAVSGNTLTASAGANTVFTFAVNGTTGAWTFTLVGHLDHAAGADENNLTINLSSIVRATNSDSDTVTAGATGLVITVNDDTPTASAVARAGAGCRRGRTFRRHCRRHRRCGRRGHGCHRQRVSAVQLRRRPAADLQPEHRHHWLADPDLRWRRRHLRGVRQHADRLGGRQHGVHLRAQRHHRCLDLHPGRSSRSAAGADENNLTINLSSIVRATDSDSDTVTAGATGLVITVNDDTPTASAVAQTGTVDEDGLPGGIAGGIGDVGGEATVPPATCQRCSTPAPTSR